jgi:hypothetical protein
MASVSPSASRSSAGTSFKRAAARLGHQALNPGRLSESLRGVSEDSVSRNAPVVILKSESLGPLTGLVTPWTPLARAMLIHTARHAGMIIHAESVQSISM